MNPVTVRTAGAGRAYQSVSQSTAIAIQDATDYMRNVSTISTTAIGVAIALVVAGNPNGNADTILTAAQTAMTDAITNFSNISKAAAGVATQYPKTFL